MSKFGAQIPKDRKIYGNCQVLSPDNILMFRCDQKKANWYLSRDLAEVTQEEPLTIKLKFQPKGLGNSDKPFGLSIMENKCVNCGTEDYLTRHHVVPICYRKHFPLHLKSHNFHDVLSMCMDCHEAYERFADQLKDSLAQKYQAPTNGILSTPVDETLVRKAISGCNLLLSDWLDKVPQSRIDEVKLEIKEFLGREYTQDDLIQISNLKTSVLEKTHGQIVVESVDNLQEFIEMWRKHFIENNECSYLPADWNVNNKIEIHEK
jgi:exonuclease 3'-5' domain-containing protein 2